MQILGLSPKDSSLKSTSMKLCLMPLWCSTARPSPTAKPTAGGSALRQREPGGLHRTAASSSCLPMQLHTEFFFPSQKPAQETWSNSELTETSSLNIHSSTSGTMIRTGGTAELKLLSVFGTCVYLQSEKETDLLLWPKASSRSAASTHKCRQLCPRRRPDSPFSHEVVFFTDTHFRGNQCGDAQRY